MLKFKTPEKLNGSQLLDELADIGIVLNKQTQAPVVDGNGDLFLDVKDKDKSKVEEIVAIHIGVDAPILISLEEKLASIGLNVNDLKVVLGLNG